MELLKKNGILIFLIILLAHCWFVFLDVGSFRLYSKLVLLPFLMLLLAVHLPNHYQYDKPGYYLPFIGLLASFSGDLLLSLHGDKFFLWGMLSFMVTHICNGMYFLALKAIRFKRIKPALIAIFMLSAVCFLVIFNIKENLGNYLIPIIVYMVLISSMAVLSVNLLSSEKYSALATHYFIPGAALFVLSDGILAMNKFSLQEPILDVFVMLTYGLAQLFLVMGFYKTARLKEQIVS